VCPLDVLPGYLVEVESLWLLVALNCQCIFRQALLYLESNDAEGGKNYDLRDAIKQIEGIKLIQQEQQKKYFLTIPSLLKVPPNLHKS
jgi:hypothetical protein